MANPDQKTGPISQPRGQDHNAKLWALAIVFLALALARDFWGLGWSFSGDEVSSFGEVRSLLNEPFFLQKPDSYAGQPRAQSVGYLMLAGCYAVFGTSEFGARVGPALAGAISIALAVLLCGKLFGFRVALLTGALMLLWPWHQNMSQINRVYSFAFLFGSTSLLLAAWAWRRNSGALGAVAGLLSAMAVATHALAVLVPVSLGLFAVFEAAFHRRTFAARSVAGYAAVGTPLLAVSCLIAREMMKGWAGIQDWGGGSLTVLMGLTYALTWEVALVALVGSLAVWFSRDGAQRLMAIAAAVSVAACAVMPAFCSFRQDYVYSSSVSFMVLAALALARLYDAAPSPHSRFVASGVIAAVLLSPLPALLSNYVDGDRNDYRAAGEYILAHLRQGDVVAADNPGTLKYYVHQDVVSAGRPAAKPQMVVTTLGELKKTATRVWYVCHSARDEPPPWADRWLSENAVHMLRIKGKRFDYHQNIVDVYLLAR